jgi:ribosome-binding ATPase YchF (GTP1/OBG family)
MTSNLGHTSLKRKPRRGDPMRDFDLLPTELQTWLASAALPWRPKSVDRVYRRALASTKNRARALDKMNRIERRLIAKDALRVWGADYPCTQLESDL